MPSDQTEQKDWHSCSTHVGDSSSLWPFCEVVGTRSDVSIFRVGVIVRADEINANSMKGAIDRDRLQSSCCLVQLLVHPLARITRLDVGING